MKTPIAKRKPFFFGALLCAIAMQCGATRAATLNGKIAFYSTRDGNNEIYVMNPDGTEQTRLTRSPGSDFHPSFTEDVSKIAFVSTRADPNFNDYGIYIMNSDGTEQKRLSPNEAGDYEPCVSPDGSRIVFISNRNNAHSHYEIYVMNADGTEQTRLTNTQSGNLNPAFSPDGRKIVFASRRDGNEEIYVMNADGSNQKRLTTTRGDDNRPCFSPDGRKIAFTTNRHGNEEIYLMNADGTEQTRLTRSSRQDFSPCFSPDGSKIAFASDRVSSEEYEIYVMNADGSNPTRLTNSRGTDAKPTWATSSVCAIRARDAGSTLEGSAANPGAATFAISLSRASEQTVTVNYRTIDNTAKSGEDYIAQNGTLTFAPGETSKMVRIEFIGDGTAEPHESFFIDLKSPANAILTDSRASAHIRNDDPPLIFIDDAPPVFEGDPPSDGAPGTTSQTFAVYLNAPSSQTVTVDYVTVSNTADATDFVPAAGRLTFAPGETQKVITILVNGDRTIEQTETYFVNLRNPTRATIADSRGIAYIRNDDIAPGVTAQDGPSQ